MCRIFEGVTKRYLNKAFFVIYMKSYLKLLIFLIIISLTVPLFASDEKNEYFLKEDEDLIWVIDLIDEHHYEATILMRIKEGTTYFLIDRTATEIKVFDPKNEVDVYIRTFSNAEEVREEAKKINDEELEKRFIDDLDKNIVLGMRIKESDAEKLPLDVRIEYKATPETFDKPSGYVNIYKNKININFEGKKEKISEFYLILPENFTVWFKNIKSDTEDEINGRIRLMWKFSERDIKNIKIHAGSSGDRSHWETLEFFINGIFIALIGIFLGVVKKSDKEKKKVRYLFLTTFCIIVVSLGLYMRTFLIETHWIYWIIFTLAVIIIIHFGGKKFF